MIYILFGLILFLIWRLFNHVRSIDVAILTTLEMLQNAQRRTVQNDRRYHA